MRTQPRTARIARCDPLDVRARDRAGSAAVLLRRDRLKELGLTESLEVGYRLSARGRPISAGDEGVELGPRALPAERG
jgi:hypothetical protein